MQYRKIDLKDYVQIGEGGNGKTYEKPSEPDLILKVNKRGLNTLEFVKKEYDVSKAVESLGIKVPKMYEIVEVADGYGTLSQRIKDKKSLSRICHDEPERLEEMARILSEKGKELASTPCNTDFFPSRKQQVLKGIEITRFISKKNRRIIHNFAETIPENDHCVHGDFQFGNIIQSGDEYYVIDLDRFAHGDFMFDVGHMFQICNMYASMKQVQNIFHMTYEQFKASWNAFAKAYTGKEDHSEFDHLAGKFACLDLVVRPVFQKVSLLEEIFFSIYIKRLVKQFF